MPRNKHPTGLTTAAGDNEVYHSQIDFDLQSGKKTNTRTHTPQFENNFSNLYNYGVLNAGSRRGNIIILLVSLTFDRNRNSSQEAISSHTQCWPIRSLQL